MHAEAVGIAGGPFSGSVLPLQREQSVECLVVLSPYRRTAKWPENEHRASHMRPSAGFAAPESAVSLAFPSRIHLLTYQISGAERRPVGYPTTLAGPRSGRRRLSGTAPTERALSASGRAPFPRHAVARGVVPSQSSGRGLPGRRRAGRDGIFRRGRVCRNPLTPPAGQFSIANVIHHG